MNQVLFSLRPWLAPGNSRTARVQKTYFIYANTATAATPVCMTARAKFVPPIIYHRIRIRSNARREGVRVGDVHSGRLH
jgi:hypothetical protein